jgi:hypothetical protein
MLKPDAVRLVRCLLGQGHSQRQTALLSGVSRSRVSAIASGRRPDYERLALERGPSIDEASGSAQWCHGCGHKVWLPCVLCALRETMARRPPPGRAAGEAIEPLGLDLREQHRQRYEEIHRRRVALEGAGLPERIGRLNVRKATADCAA